jgi:hypothetical protein
MAKAKATTPPVPHELVAEAAWCADCTWHAGGTTCDQRARQHLAQTGHSIEVEFSSVVLLGEPKEL